MLATHRTVLAAVATLALAVLASVAVGRTWTSRDGKFTTEATLVDLRDGQVSLKKADGKEIRVPLSKLCDEDQRFVQEKFPQSRQEPAEESGEYREWSSSNGKFTIRAKMLDYRQGKVRLEKPDGKEIEVPISQLSADDRRWVSGEMRRRRESGSNTDEEDGTSDKDEEEGKAGLPSEPRSGEDDEEISEPLGARTVDMKLVAIHLPTTRMKKKADLWSAVRGIINPQGFTVRGDGSENLSEKGFRGLVKKEPKYTSEKPLRGVARLGSKQFLLALDAVGTKPEGYNRLYFDANGNGDLTDDEPVNTKDIGGSQTSKRTHTAFRNVKAPLDIDGVQLEYIFDLDGDSFQLGTGAYTRVTLTSAVVREGQIDVGGKKVRLLLVDHNSNGRFDDRAEVHSQGQRAFLAVGDVFLFNPGARKSRSPAADRAPDYLFVNRLVCIGGHFYKLEVTPAGDQLKLEPAELITGHVMSSSPKYRVVVYNDDYGVLLIGGTKVRKVVLPEGEWKLASYTIHVPGGRTTVTAEYPGDSHPISVKKDNTTELPLGAPFRPVVTASRIDGKKVSLTLTIVGKGGERCTSFFIKGRQPANPGFKVLAEDGRVVYTGKFEFG